MVLPTSQAPCAGCSTPTRARHGYCAACRKADITLPHAARPLSANAGSPGPTPPSDSTIERGDQRDQTIYTTSKVKTLEDLIRVCEIDTNLWEIVEWQANKWEMGWVNRTKDNDTAQALPLFQVKARMKKRVLHIAALNEIDSLKERAKTLFMFKPNARAFDKKSGDNMLEIDIFDLHLGKLAWAKETGYEHYDLKIARKLFEEALEVLIQRTSSHQFSRVILPIGNDFFHTDNLTSETTGGTRQDMDGRFHKTAHIGREMLVHATERLRGIAPVDLVVTPGNHDQLSAWHLGDSLECYFHNDRDVTVHNQPILRKYVEFGKVMLMFTHGNRGKQADYPALMATEQPLMWGRTKFREAHVGHLHRTQLRNALAVSEKFGARVRIISSLCAADAWHSEMQFVGNLRQAEAFVWNAHEGQIAHATFTSPDTL